MELLSHPASTFGLALILGVAGQALARRISVPGIIVLLAFGVLAGPGVANIVRPENLGATLELIVGSAVAVILFEGGLQLQRRRLAQTPGPIRLLVTLGALVTLLGGALAARFCMGWSWSLSFLFGALVIVTGPTVVTPLLRRLRVHRRVATVLEAEGVLIDAVGAIAAAAALEVVLEHEHLSWLQLGANVVLRLGVGTIIGAAAGLLLAVAYRWLSKRMEDLANGFVLASVVGLFHLANAGFEESGIAAATVCGVVMTNRHLPGRDGLIEFKEQLVPMLIGLLFVLLAAGVQLDAIGQLGLGALAVVAILMLVVRPVAAWLCTVGAGMSKRERVFVGLIGPRGIVAAAVASFFAERLHQRHIAGGVELQALVFVVIAISVIFAGGAGPIMARVLGLRRPSDQGWLILGANPLARWLGAQLKTYGDDVACIDSNPDQIRAAEKSGLRVVFGNGLDDRTLLRGEVDTRLGVIAMTNNEAVNQRFSERAHHVGRPPRSLVALSDTHQGITEKMVEARHGQVLFGKAVDVNKWSVRVRQKGVNLSWWQPPEGVWAFDPALDALPVLRLDDRNNVRPFSGYRNHKNFVSIGVLTPEANNSSVEQRLHQQGWTKAGAPSRN